MAVNLYDSYCTATFNLLTSTINITYNDGVTGDTGRGIYLGLRNGTVPLTPTSETVILYAVRPDGTKVQVVAETEGNDLRFDFNDAIFQVPGTVRATVQLIDGSGLKLTSNMFVIEAVFGILDAPYVTSADDFQLIQSALNELSNARQILIDGAEGLEATYAPRLTGVEDGLENKADITYVDMKIASVASGSPQGTYATLVDLQTAYPTGAEGIYIVSADGNWYFWNSTAWESGGSYQGIELAVDSVTSDKRTAIGETVILVKGVNSIPNYSTTLKTLTIYNGTQVLYRGVLTALVGDSVLNCATDNMKVLYNVKTNVFRAVTFATVASEDEVVLCSVRSTTHPYVFGNNFEYNIDGIPKLSADLTVYDLLPDPVVPTYNTTINYNGSLPIMYSNGNSNFYPAINTSAKTLTFPKGVGGSGFYVNGVAIALPNTVSDLVVDITKTVVSNMAIVLLKKADGTIHLIDSAAQFTTDYVQIGTIVYSGNFVYPSFVCPHYLDYKLYDVESVEYISVDDTARLKDSDKIKRYLNSDTSTYTYIKNADSAEFVEAVYASGSEQARLYEGGSLLFWKDETHTLLSTVDRGGSEPVMVYTYTETVKGELDFGTTNGVKTVNSTYNATATLRNIIVTTETPDVSMGNINDIIIQIAP